MYINNFNLTLGTISIYAVQRILGIGGIVLQCTTLNKFFVIFVISFFIKFFVDTYVASSKIETKLKNF